MVGIYFFFNSKREKLFQLVVLHLDITFEIIEYNQYLPNQGTWIIICWFTFLQKDVEFTKYIHILSHLSFRIDCE